MAGGVICILSSGPGMDPAAHNTTRDTALLDTSLGKCSNHFQCSEKAPAEDWPLWRNIVDIITRSRVTLYRATLHQASCWRPPRARCRGWGRARWSPSSSAASSVSPPSSSPPSSRSSSSRPWPSSPCSPPRAAFSPSRAVYFLSWARARPRPSHITVGLSSPPSCRPSIIFLYPIQIITFIAMITITRSVCCYQLSSTINLTSIPKETYLQDHQNHFRSYNKYRSDQYRASAHPFHTSAAQQFSTRNGREE